VLVTGAGIALAACRGAPPRPAPPPSPLQTQAAAAPAIARIDAAIHRYAGDRAGRLPVDLDALTREGPPGGGRYLYDLPLDPWGRPFAYAVTDPRVGAYDLRSYGPDTMPGTGDDVVGRRQTVPVGTSE
jgi:hypothetical protein